VECNQTLSVRILGPNPDGYFTTEEWQIPSLSSNTFMASLQDILFGKPEFFIREQSFSLHLDQSFQFPYGIS
jgi:hypothetical protein